MKDTKFQKVANFNRSWWLTAMFLAVAPFLHWKYTAEPENSIRYLWLSVTCVLFIISVLLSARKGRQNIILNNALVLFIAFTCYTGIHVFAAFHFWEGLYEWSQSLLILLATLWFTFLFKTTSDPMRKLLPMTAVSFIIISIFGAIQLISIITGDANGSLRLNELHAVFSNKNFFGQATLLTLPFLLTGIWIYPNRSFSLIFLLLSLVGVGFIILTRSAAVYFSLAMASLFVIICMVFIRDLRPGLLTGRVKWIRVILAIMITGGSIFIWKSGVVRDTFVKAEKLYRYAQQPAESLDVSNAQNDNSAFERVILYRNSWSMFLDHPLTGCGLSNWKILFPKYGITGSNYMVTGRLRYEHPHNDYLYVLCQTGPLGLAIWLLIFILTISSGLGILKKTELSKTQKLTVLTMISGIIAFMLLSLFSYPKERFWSMFMTGLMIVVVNSYSAKERTFKCRIEKVFLWILLVIVVFVAWLHYRHVRSEVFTRAALKSRVMREHSTVLKLLNKTEPDMFPLDETSTPKSWYAGGAFHATGQLASAKAAYERSVSENPYHIHTWNDLGSVYEQTGDPKKALDAYHYALDINPKFPDALMNIGVTQYNLGHTDSALFYLNRYPFKKRPEYRNNLNVILTNSLSHHFSETGDTIRIAEIDSILRSDRYYLTDQYRIHHQNLDSLTLFVDSPK